MHLSDPAADIVLDTPGRRRAGARAALRDDGRVEAVSFVNVPSFVLRGGTPIDVDGRVVPVDVAFGGAFYAIVDGKAAGVPLRREELARLRALGGEIRDRIDKAVDVVHPADPRLHGIYGTIFTGPPNREDAHLCNVTVFADAQVDSFAVRRHRHVGGDGGRRRDGAAGPPPRRFVHESLIGTTFRGNGRGPDDGRRPGGHRAADSRAAPGSPVRHEFLLDDDDPLCEGFLL